MRDWSSVHRGQAVPPTITNAPEELFKLPSPEAHEECFKIENLEVPAKGLKLGLLYCMMVLLSLCGAASQVERMMIPYINVIMKKMPQKRCVIHFSEDDLRALKVKAQEHAATWVTTNEALLSHLHPLLLEVFNVTPTGKVGAQVIVNMRGKVKGITERMVGNWVSLVHCVYEPQNCERKTLADQVHHDLRAKLTEEHLIHMIQVFNEHTAIPAIFRCKHLRKGTRGVIDHWNYQVTTPYLDVDFGVGKPTRVQPWAFEPVKVMKSLKGGVDVYINKFSLASWAQDRYAAVNKLLSLSQLGLICAVVLYRTTISRQQVLTGGVLFAMVVAFKRSLANMHTAYVDSCFKALEEHPLLRSFE